MSKRPIGRTPAHSSDEKPLRRADIASGKLVLRKRGATRAVLPNKAVI
jgi:hypothetical protein